MRDYQAPRPQTRGVPPNFSEDRLCKPETGLFPSGTVTSGTILDTGPDMVRPQ